MYHGSWRLASLVLRCLLKMCHVQGIAYFSTVIPYIIFREWQLLSFFHNNLSYRTCAEKAYDWRMKSQISTWPAGERGSMIYWTHPKLPLKDVSSLSSLHITLHVALWTDNMTVIRYIANESKRFHTYVANRIAVREESNPSLIRST